MSTIFFPFARAYATRSAHLYAHSYSNAEGKASRLVQTILMECPFFGISADVTEKPVTELRLIDITIYGENSAWRSLLELSTKQTKIPLKNGRILTTTCIGQSALQEELIQNIEGFGRSIVALQLRHLMVQERIEGIWVKDIVIHPEEENLPDLEIRLVQARFAFRLSVREAFRCFEKK